MLFLLTILTFVNPLDVNYKVVEAPVYYEYSTPADPEIILHQGAYWLFASKSDGYFKSSDLVHWQWIRTRDLPTGEWAPTVESIDGTLFFTARAGTVFKARDLDAGKWERVPGKVPGSVDSALFADDSRLFLYWGGSTNKNPIFGCEIDPATFTAKTKPTSLFAVDTQRYGWEVRGDNNDQTNVPAYVEGAHMFKRDGRYFLQYAAPGTQFASYADAALVGETPLGPFRRQRHNPFSYKSTGYVPSAGHGKTFSDRHGNVWHVATGLVEGFNRRLVMFPVFFDADGEMWCDTAFGDWPFAVPDHKVTHPDELRTGWMELAEGKSVRATSSADGFPPEMAVDGRIATYWRAATGNPGECLTVDFGQTATIRSVQVGFAGTDETRRFRIEARSTQGEWMLCREDKGDRPYAEHAYFQLPDPIRADAIRVVNTEKMAKNSKFAIRGLRVFGAMDKPRPASPQGLVVRRDANDRRHATVSWDPVPDARGYLVRFGVSPEKMHLSRQVKECRVDVRSLSIDEKYCWNVTAYNEAGLGNPGNRVDE